MALPHREDDGYSGEREKGAISRTWNLVSRSDESYARVTGDMAYKLHHSFVYVDKHGVTKTWRAKLQTVRAQYRRRKKPERDRKRWRDQCFYAPLHPWLTGLRISYMARCEKAMCMWKKVKRKRCLGPMPVGTVYPELYVSDDI